MKKQKLTPNLVARLALINTIPMIFVLLFVLYTYRFFIGEEIMTQYGWRLWFESLEYLYWGRLDNGNLGLPIQPVMLIKYTHYWLMGWASILTIGLMIVKVSVEDDTTQKVAKPAAILCLFMMTWFTSFVLHQVLVVGEQPTDEILAILGTFSYVYFTLGVVYIVNCYLITSILHRIIPTSEIDDSVALDAALAREE